MHEEGRTRRALLHMLEDLEAERRLVKAGRAQWIETADAISDAIMVHDSEGRVVRANHAYAKLTGRSFPEIVGCAYWECFPLRDGPLPECVSAACAAGHGRKEFELPGGDIYASRAFAIHHEDAGGAHTLHLFENVTVARAEQRATHARTRRIVAHSGALGAIGASPALAAGDIVQFARTVTEQVAGACEVARASIWLFNPEATELRCIDHFDAASGSHSAGMVLREDQFEAEFRALKSESHVAAAEPLTDPRTAGYAESYLMPNRITSMLDTVVVYSGRRLGMLCLEHVDRPHHWEADEVAFAGQVTGLIALALSNQAARRAERAMRASELRFRTIFEKAPVGIAECSPAGRYLAANAVMCEITGYSASELLSLYYKDITHPDDVARDDLGLKRMHSGEISTHRAEKRYVRKDGTTVWVSLLVVPVRDANGMIQYLLSIAKDITARRYAEERIRALARLPEENPHPVIRIGGDGRVLYANPASRSLLKRCGALPGETAQGHWVEMVRECLADGAIQEVEEEVEERCFELTVSPIVEEGYANIYGADITERRQARAELERRERFFRKLTEGGSDAFFVVGRDGRLLHRSESGTRLTGYATEDVLGRNLTTLVQPESLPEVRRALAAVIENPEQTSRAELRIARKDGSITEVEAVGRNFLDDPDVGGIVVTAHDITQRKAADRALRESEERFRAIFDSASDGIVVMDIKARSVRFANVGMERMLGYAAWELVGLTIEELVPPEAIARVTEEFALGTRGEAYFVQDVPLRRRDGQALVADVTGGPVEIGGQRYLLCAFRDATERRAGEAQLRRLNRALKTLSACNEALVRAPDEASLLGEMARLITDVGGYPLALIGYAVDDAERSVSVAAEEGFTDEELRDRVALSWADNERGQSCIGRALRTGAVQMVRDVTIDPRFAPWREMFVAKNVGSAVGLPLRLAPGEAPFGAIGIAASHAEGFDGDELKLLEELAGNVSYGIANLRAQAERRATAEKLRASLEGTIGAIAATMETRDPYTAGHQRRVADLAAAIAAELGLSQHTIEGLRFGALIHDLGKIQVPAEILSKPTRLTPLEFELIKTHSRTGHEIIKGIDFPWPVAAMVLQHHERLDGSGYPQGLAGDAILVEARVLAVADVVEAMSSHRPYRPGLGIDVALKEIEAKRGTWFDPAAVDACLRLFREKDFAFTS